MKNIHDIRIENLKEILEKDFDGRQSRLAERMGTEPNLISRWVNAKKKIGDQSARKIESVAGRPVNWLDVDHYFSLNSVVPAELAETGEIGELAAHNLKNWMSVNHELSSQQKVATASGVSQATINRFLRNEASITLSNLEAIAQAFGRRGYEMLIPPADPTQINYDRGAYVLLPEAEKDKIKSFIEFIISSHTKNK